MDCFTLDLKHLFLRDILFLLLHFLIDLLCYFLAIWQYFGCELLGVEKEIWVVFFVELFQGIVERDGLLVVVKVDEDVVDTLYQFAAVSQIDYWLS